MIINGFNIYGAKIPLKEENCFLKKGILIYNNSKYLIKCVDAEFIVNEVHKFLSIKSVSNNLNKEKTFKLIFIDDTDNENVIIVDVMPDEEEKKRVETPPSQQKEKENKSCVIL
jgi:hypothetical protein